MQACEHLVVETLDASGPCSLFRVAAPERYSYFKRALVVLLQAERVPVDRLVISNAHPRERSMTDERVRT